MIKVTLKKYLEDIDKSLHQLHFETGITYTNLHKFANNKTTRADFETIDKIMTALDITDFNEILSKE